MLYPLRSVGSLRKKIWTFSWLALSALSALSARLKSGQETSALPSCFDDMMAWSLRARVLGAAGMSCRSGENGTRAENGTSVRRAARAAAASCLCGWEMGSKGRPRPQKLGERVHSATRAGREAMALREAKSIILTWHGEAAGADCCCSCWVQCCRGKRALPSASRSWGRMQLQI